MVTWGPETLGYFVAFNFSLELGIENERDTAVRMLFRDENFRKALSYATDRDGIAQSIMRGPFLRGWAGGIYPGAPGFDKESVVYYPFDVASANMLLDEMGLVDGDGNGVREFADGPMAGEDIVILLTANQDQAEAVSIAEAMVNLYGDLGLQINFRPTDSATQTNREEAGTWEMHVWRGGQEMALPFKDITLLAPITDNYRYNRVAPVQERTMMDVEKQMADIVTEYRLTFDPEGRAALLNEYINIYTESAYSVGVFVGRYGLGVAKRSMNVPDGTPVFMYQWVADAILLDTMWTPVDQQKEQVRPNAIPVYGD